MRKKVIVRSANRSVGLTERTIAPARPCSSTGRCVAWGCLTAPRRSPFTGLVQPKENLFLGNRSFGGYNLPKANSERSPERLKTGVFCGAEPPPQRLGFATPGVKYPYKEYL